ncbi:hypothetical protein R3X26_15640 [Vibrio sp. TH_r3]|uniref:hypothetical protein n=1 Tax=Vibrio sp. TH_r3 TaxID=3082084 RepID=UPI002953AC7D|nr:hypothetical protein [Vibrio sp. TH_r3]MDV7105837.1 hypothetical protein [Vibrio sp. TH_r3]
MEGKSRARQVALCLGLVAFKGKTYFEKHPLHVLAIALLGGMVCRHTKRLNGSLINLNHISLVANTLKNGALKNSELKNSTKN